MVMSLCFRLGSRMGFFGMQTVQHRLRMQVTERLLHPAGMQGRLLGGSMLSAATGDVFRLAATMQLGIYPVGEVAAVLAAAVMLLVISWPLGLDPGMGRRDLHDHPRHLRPRPRLPGPQVDEGLTDS